jgi:glycosyltransferase involved in cell wall biosynthesis
VKVLQVYNDYRSRHGGEINVVQMISTLIERRGHEARLLTASSKGLDDTLIGKIKAFASGIYNRSAYRQMLQSLRDDRPDIVHVHNLYPWFSPSVLVACREEGLPVVMTNHNYLLTCPVVSHLYRGKVCEKCFGGKEYHCVLQNCRENMAESVAYAARSFTARKLDLFRSHVTIQIMLSDFARRRLIKTGFDEDRVVVLPNMVELGPEPKNDAPGQYAAFSGRMAAGKGVDILLSAAANLPDVPVRLAGDGSILDDLKAAAPANAKFLDRLGPVELAEFYRNSRFLVVPSRWFEGCPLVVSEAMSHGLPVIASRIGGLPEFVDDGVTGLLFEPGNVAELTDKIRLLWNDPELCRRMGEAGRAKACRAYNEDVYYGNLMSIYNQAIELNAKQTSSPKSVALEPLPVSAVLESATVESAEAAVSFASGLSHSSIKGSLS